MDNNRNHAGCTLGQKRTWQPNGKPLFFKRVSFLPSVLHLIHGIRAALELDRQEKKGRGEGESHTKRGEGRASKKTHCDNLVLLNVVNF